MKIQEIKTIDGRSDITHLIMFFFSTAIEDTNNNKDGLHFQDCAMRIDGMKYTLTRPGNLKMSHLRYLNDLIETLKEAQHDADARTRIIQMFHTARIAEANGLLYK